MLGKRVFAQGGVDATIEAEAQQVSCHLHVTDTESLRPGLTNLPPLALHVCAFVPCPRHQRSVTRSTLESNGDTSIGAAILRVGGSSANLQGRDLTKKATVTDHPDVHGPQKKGNFCPGYPSRRVRERAHATKRCRPQTDHSLALRHSALLPMNLKARAHLRTKSKLSRCPRPAPMPRATRSTLLR